MKKTKLSNVKQLTSVQLTLDLPQFLIQPGSRVLVIPLDRTGRIAHIWWLRSPATGNRDLREYVVCLPGGQLVRVDRSEIVEIE